MSLSFFLSSMAFSFFSVFFFPVEYLLALFCCCFVLGQESKWFFRFLVFFIKQKTLVFLKISKNYFFECSLVFFSTGQNPIKFHHQILIISASVFGFFTKYKRNCFIFFRNLTPFRFLAFFVSCLLNSNLKNSVSSSSFIFSPYAFSRNKKKYFFKIKFLGHLCAILFLLFLTAFNFSKTALLVFYIFFLDCLFRLFFLF
jgi:hypothetical protein